MPVRNKLTPFKYNGMLYTVSIIHNCKETYPKFKYNYNILSWNKDYSVLKTSPANDFRSTEVVRFEGYEESPSLHFIKISASISNCGGFVLRKVRSVLKTTGKYREVKVLQYTYRYYSGSQSFSLL